VPASGSWEDGCAVRFGGGAEGMPTDERRLPAAEMLEEKSPILSGGPRCSPGARPGQNYRLEAGHGDNLIASRPSRPPPPRPHAVRPESTRTGQKWLPSRDHPRPLQLRSRLTTASHTPAPCHSAQSMPRANSDREYVDTRSPEEGDLRARSDKAE
jgi:hypothetical protein